MGFTESIKRLLTVTAAKTGQAVTLTIGATTGIKGALVGSQSGMDFGEFDKTTPRLLFMVPWGATTALPQIGGPVAVTAGQHVGETFDLVSIQTDARASAGHIVIECGGTVE